MPKGTLPLLQLIFWFSLITSIIGGGSYAAYRLMERRSPRFTVFAGLISFVAFFMYLSVHGMRDGFLWLTGIPIVPAVVGGWLHRRSGGFSSRARQAFILSYSSIVLSTHIQFWIVETYGSPIFVPLKGVTNQLGDAQLNVLLAAYAFGVFCYPVLAPLALWIWQILRVRPGVDQPLDDGEDAPLSAH